MTTEELAKIIGVSRVTLSKVINGVGGVAPRTERKIREYIDKYNFVPNSKARSLVGKEEHVIGLFSAYSDKNSGASSNITSHFATEMINLVISNAQKCDYKTLVYLTEREKDVKSIERILNSSMVRGAILLGYDTGSAEIKRLAERGYPLVLVNQERDSYCENVVVVNMDDQVSAYYAIERLVHNGHRNILYIGCDRPRLPAIRRHEGVRSAEGKWRHKIEKLTEIDCDFSEEKAYREIYRMYSSPEEGKPTGIFAANDIMAIGAMNALKDLGYDIPADVSIIGFDDISISKYLTPGLTTMRCNFDRIASVSVNSLVNLIEQRDTARHVESPVEFVERGTLAKAKGTQ
ncbi:MAG: LacI family transcriptional regulator [Ruminiclostridium sp.]|nr:LacI family transcriptional regulator [Ruminiclostridium sp.]